LALFLVYGIIIVEMINKREYTRKVSPDNVTLISKPLNVQDKGIIPSYYQEAIRKDIEHRKRLGLFDDSKERWERAIRYWGPHGQKI
jgi:hypothetical protein